MKMAFDAKRLFLNDTGLGNYSRSLVRQLSQLYSEDEILLFTPEIEMDKYNEFSEPPYQVVNGGNKFLWRYSGMVQDLRDLQPDIFHGLSNEIPRGTKKLRSTKFIVTIHDLIFLRYPQFYPLLDRAFYREKFKRACLESDHIIAISNSTKDDIVEFFRIDPSKISVIYQACSEIYYEEADEKVDKENYGLFVGTGTERKNLDIVVDAISMMKPENRPVIKIVGRGGKYQKRIEAKIKTKSVKDSFEFVGPLDDRELMTFYKKAKFSLYPSLYEGFGIPILESLLCGTPVITSNLSSMPEAALGFGKLVDPKSAEEVKQAILYMCFTDNRLSKSDVNLVRNQFNPVKHAKKTYKLYRDVLKS